MHFFGMVKKIKRGMASLQPQNKEVNTVLNATGQAIYKKTAGEVASGARRQTTLVTVVIINQKKNPILKKQTKLRRSLIRRKRKQRKQRCLL